MCGEHHHSSVLLIVNLGSSPLVRGALLRRTHGRAVDGIIPACAGSTFERNRFTCRGQDHPRLCGEHHGKPSACDYVTGSSPLVRGARHAVDRAGAVGGIIPACAGSTTRPTGPPTATRDHPRLCGEHQGCRTAAIGEPGSSPLVRGAHGALGYGNLTGGIIPACAGSTTLPAGTGWRDRDHPRLCGEHCERCPLSCTPSGSSPLVRGARCGRSSSIQRLGIIPACAGSTMWAQ